MPGTPYLVDSNVLLRWLSYERRIYFLGTCVTPARSAPPQLTPDP
jgi:hypothetical protein